MTPLPAQNGVLSAQNGVVQTTLQQIIEDFEHNDPSVWQSDGGGTWEIQTTNVYEGDYAGRLTGTKRVWNHPNWGGLEHYPQSGDFWEFYFRLTQHDGQVRFYLARDDVDGFDTSLGYRFQLYSDGTFRLRDSDGNNLAETYDVTYDLDTWYRVRHWWNHPEFAADHHIQLYDMSTDTEIAAESGNAATVDRNSGGVMMYANSGADVQYDEIQINDRSQ